jgi:hypothetical protein
MTMRTRALERHELLGTMVIDMTKSAAPRAQTEDRRDTALTLSADNQYTIFTGA